jgi:hypothetical protein
MRGDHWKVSEIVDNDLILDQKKHTLYSDVMQIDGSMFLITVCDPLNLTLQVHV